MQNKFLLHKQIINRQESKGECHIISDLVTERNITEQQYGQNNK